MSGPNCESDVRSTKSQARLPNSAPKRPEARPLSSVAVCGVPQFSSGIGDWKVVLLPVRSLLLSLGVNAFPALLADFVTVACLAERSLLLSLGVETLTAFSLLQSLGTAVACVPAVALPFAAPLERLRPLAPFCCGVATGSSPAMMQTARA